MEKKRKKAIPKAVELRIRIVPMNPEPIDNEYWQFYCSFPRRWSPDTQIVAKTAKQAKGNARRLTLQQAQWALELGGLAMKIGGLRGVTGSS